MAHAVQSKAGPRGTRHVSKRKHRMQFCPSINHLTIFFFFQAEDGIRDTSVTGVQTCALPILRAKDIPLVRRSRVVVMKFSEPSNWPTQKIAMDSAQRV